MMAAEAWTLVSLLEVTARYLADKGSESARLDAELLLAETLGIDQRVKLYLQFDRPLDAAELDAYRALVKRRAGGEPVAYILGRTFFYEEELEVTPAVLIPRPATETLVEAALGRLTDLDASGARMADVGTGTGAVAIAVARQRPGLGVVATEIEPEVAALARRNVARYDLSARVEVVVADLFEPQAGPSLEGPFDLIVSNPPYIAEGDPRLETAVRAYEPATALFAGADGLSVIRRLLPAALQRLRPGGALLIEVGQGQCEAVIDLATPLGYHASPSIKDLAGIERVVVLDRP